MSDPVAPPEAMDVRLAVFCEPNVREVFEAVVAPTQIWRADPYDVGTIHAEAREAFGRLVARATSVPPPDRGRVLLLLGEAGSGKTHLMRAFRAAAHRDGSAHFAYLQLTTAAAHYGPYVLSNVIASLEHPYAAPAEQATGLQRLSTALLDAVPDLSADDREAVRSGDADAATAAVFDAAERLLATPAFAGRDEDLVRALLFLQRDDPRVRSKVLKWLRGEDLNPYDRQFVGQLTPRPEPERATATIAELGRLMWAAQGAALVLCVDQLEDIFNQSESAERFRLVADVLVTFAEQLPTGVVVLSCLEDYYRAHRASLPKPRLDRIEHDPEPVTLGALRSATEVADLVACRLAVMYDEAGLTTEANSTFPFRPEHLAPLANLNTRKLLDYCRLHHLRCVVAGRWEEPAGPHADARRPVFAPVAPAPFNFDQAWNDAVNRRADVPDDDAQRTALLARAAERCNAELPAPYRLTAAAADNRIDVQELGVGDPVRFLVALCERDTRGGGLARQVAAAEAAAAGRPVVLVRSTPFQYGPNTQIAKQVGQLLRTAGGRKVEVVDSDWRAMVAFETFAETHGRDPAFAAWQREARPLSRLRSVQEVLDLRALAERRVQPVPVAVAPATSAAKVDPAPPRQADAPPSDLKLGRTRAIIPEPVLIHPEELKQHMVFIGGSGTGKTTAALRLIEQLLARGVPAVLVDRKGDLARYADPSAWDVPDDPSLPIHGPRRRALRANLDVALYTPGSGDRGRPLGLSVFPDELAGATDTDRGELARFSADALGSMMGLTGRSQSHGTLLAILSKAIEVMAQATPAGQPVQLEAVRGLVAGQEDTLLNAVGGLDAKHYRRLAELMLTMQINHGSLLSTTGGERLDVGRLLGPADGPRRGRLTILNTQSLGSDAAVQFWLSRFLFAIDRWRARTSSPTLAAVLFVDEADQYLPAVGKPPTKGPLESLLKRGRSAGLGVMLATQSPGDLDYKGRDNVRSWLVGRVQEAVGIRKMKDMFATANVDVAARLPALVPGEFYLMREGRVTSVKAGRSLIDARQMGAEDVVALAGRRPRIAG